MRAIRHRGFQAPTAGEGHYELGDLRRRRGDVEGARAAFGRARELGWVPQSGEALLRCRLGDDAAAWDDLRMRIDAEVDTVGRTRLLPAAVEIALARHRVDEADRYCTELENSAEKFDSPGFRAWARQARGRFWSNRNARPRRYRCCRTRCGDTETPGAGTRWHRCMSGWPRLIGRQGDGAAAASHAASADSLFLDFGAEPSHEAVCELPGGLTKREAEVLGCIAAGASNREVAKQLFISDKTVGRHLANIFVKLGVSSRTAAAAWAHENRVLPAG